jgi:hypothetical protein
MHKILFIFILIQNCYAGNIQIIGQTSNSKFIAPQISSDAYVQTLLLLKQGIDSQVVNGLGSLDAPAASWQLQKFSVGVGMSGEIGVGPYKFGKAIKQRFVFSR